MNNNVSKKLLIKLPIFQHLTDDEYRILAFVGKRQHLSEGETLYVANAVSDGAMLITAWRVKLIFEDGRPNIIAGRGMLLNELSLFSSKQYHYTIEAIDKITIMVFSRDEFMHLMAEFPEIGQKIQNNIIKRVSEVAEAF